jgi:uncharacterized protein involved in response to NO
MNFVLELLVIFGFWLAGQIIIWLHDSVSGRVFAVCVLFSASIAAVLAAKACAAADDPGIAVLIGLLVLFGAFNVCCGIAAIATNAHVIRQTMKKIHVRNLSGLMSSNRTQIILAVALNLVAIALLPLSTKTWEKSVTLLSLLWIVNIIPVNKRTRTSESDISKSVQ